VSETDQKLPSKFGSFYLYDHLGSGGMAEIFLAKVFTDLGAERSCAIKRILPDLSSDNSFGEMLINEAKLCSRLSHANIVQTYDLGNQDGLYYIAMEYVEGFDLNRLLSLLSKAGIALPLQFSLYIIIEILNGLDYAHRLTNQKGNPLEIIHRDVSPTNVLISTQGEVKVCDFGIAKAALGDLEAQTIDAYHLKGKVAYMSPEHLNHEEIDSRADLYAAGILLWELLSGRRLFKAKDEDETLRRAKASEVPILENRGFPEYEMLAGIVIKALEKEPLDRFQTGQKCIHAIHEYMQKAGLVVSQLKFSDFLMENFGESLLEQRGAREQSLQRLIEHQTELDDAQIKQTKQSEDERAEAILATFSEWDDDSGPHQPRLKDALAGSRELSADDNLHKEVRNSLPTLSVRLGSDNKEHIASRALLVVIIIALAAVAALGYFYFK
jgi:serine/threonine-protein kinase